MAVAEQQPATPDQPTQGDKARNYHQYWQPRDDYDPLQQQPTPAQPRRSSHNQRQAPRQPDPPQQQQQPAEGTAGPQQPTLGGANSSPPPIPHTAATTTTHTALRSGKWLTRVEYLGDIPTSDTPALDPTQLSLTMDLAPPFSGETWMLLEPLTARQWIATIQQTPGGAYQEPGTLRLMIGDQFIITRTPNSWTIQYTIMTPTPFVQATSQPPPGAPIGEAENPQAPPDTGRTEQADTTTAEQPEPQHNPRDDNNEGEQQPEQPSNQPDPDHAQQPPSNIPPGLWDGRTLRQSQRGGNTQTAAASSTAPVRGTTRSVTRETFEEATHLPARRRHQKLWGGTT